jgi:hypothetical protein
MGNEVAEAAEEGALSGHAAEGDAGGGGADEVGWSGQPDEDLRQELVGDPQRGSFLGSLRQGAGEPNVSGGRALLPHEHYDDGERSWRHEWRWQRLRRGEEAGECAAGKSVGLFRSAMYWANVNGITQAGPIKMDPFLNKEKHKSYP